MTAGYSKKSLQEKLGIKEDMRISILQAPKNYYDTLGVLPARVEHFSGLHEHLDMIQFFTTSKHELYGKFPLLKKLLAVDGMLWISWPKGSSGVDTDLNENIVQQIGLDHGLVDVKVCAIDETWSGLKFVFRLKDRPKK